MGKYLQCYPSIVEPRHMELRCNEIPDVKYCACCNVFPMYKSVFPLFRCNEIPVHFGEEERAREDSFVYRSKALEQNTTTIPCRISNVPTLTMYVVAKVCVKAHSVPEASLTSSSCRTDWPKMHRKIFTLPRHVVHLVRSPLAGPLQSQTVPSK